VAEVTTKLSRRALLRAGAGAIASGGVAALGCGSGDRPVAAAGRTAALDRAQVSAALSRRDDALVRQVRAELRSFTDWLARHRVRGFIGEVGWPSRPRVDARAWTALAERWYHDADTAGLWVTNWAAGEWWGRYRLATYRASAAHGTLDRAGPQARVVEAHPSTARYRRGVAVAGGAFGAPAVDATSSFSNASPGIVERDYHFDHAQSLQWLRARGIDLVRIEFRWERIQPQLGADLRVDELRRLQDIVQAAGDAGLGVVLDLHNYGAYYKASGGRGVRRLVGSPQVPTSALTDLWLRLSDAFAGSSAVAALGLMNEPVHYATNDYRSAAAAWEDISGTVVSALRGAHESRAIAVGGAFWSRLRGWPQRHPEPWIDDPNVLYEAHHYWDRDHDSTYELSYRAQRAAVTG
jgi:cellulase (glycosyl hydrolase family 5)